MLQFLTLLSLALSLVQGLAIPNVARGSEPAPLLFDFTVLQNIGNSSVKALWAQHNEEVAKRDGYPVTIVDYKDLSYHIDVYLGSNKQKTTVSLDTGSSDLWVPSNNYNAGSSSTSKDTGSPFTIAYVDGTRTLGEYYLDTLQFENAAPIIPNFEFARSSVSGGFGVLGIANKNEEANSNKYNNLPWALQAAGLTPKASYSLFLGPEGQSGKVIFGGIDTEKYTGELAKYPINQSQGLLSVDVQSVTFNGNNIAVNGPMVLDSGTSLGLLNLELMKELDVLFDTTIDTQGSVQYRYTSCDQPSDKFLEFNFGSNTISLSYADAIYNQGNGKCLLGFGYLNNLQILGDVFLRKAYVYYDLSDETVSLAQASYSSSSNIISA